jgi:hypothetical protein
MALKHVGRVANTGKKVLVAYRVVPGEPDSCLVIPTQALDAAQHDSAIKVVESNAGQNAYELAEAMSRTTLPDGMNMLVGMQKYGKMVKAKTDTIEMTPDSKSIVNLAELNKMIAEQKGVTVADLALKGGDGKTVQPKDSGPAINPLDTYSSNTPTSDGVLTDEDLAAQYRSQADALFKEAKVLREQAEELVPTKKKSKASAKTAQ